MAIVPTLVALSFKNRLGVSQEKWLGTKKSARRGEIDMISGQVVFEDSRSGRWYRVKKQRSCCSINVHRVISVLARELIAGISGGRYKRERDYAISFDLPARRGCL